MSQILAVVHRTARGRSAAEYEDLDEQAADSLPSIGSISRQLEDSYGSHIAGADDMEMTSVSVVPDGTYNSIWGFFPLYIFASTQAVNAFGFWRGAEFSFDSPSIQKKKYLWMYVFLPDTFTVTQAVNAFGFGRFQVKLSLFTGLCWMADSMEMTILSILSPALHCDWHITRYQQALTTTVSVSNC